MKYLISKPDITLYFAICRCLGLKITRGREMQFKIINLNQIFI